MRTLLDKRVFSGPRALIAGRRRRDIVLGGTLALLVLISLIAATWLTVKARTPAPATSSVPSIFQAGGYDLGKSTVAPTFTLPDQHGSNISLTQFHGQPVVLTFFDSVCPHADCSIMAQYLNVTAQHLGAQSSRFAWVALTVNPWHDTPASATTFLQTRQVTVPLHYLLGTPAQLAPVWKAYHMQAVLQSDGIVIHTTGVYVIDASGHERAFVEEGFNPESLSAYLLQMLKQSGGAHGGVTSATPAGVPSGTVNLSQTVHGEHIAFTATPAQYGTYTFTVTIEDDQGIPIQGATVALALRMTTMQMLPVNVTLPPITPPVPGSYQAQGVISMLGAWQAVVSIAAPGAQPVDATFNFNARF
ncbi:MAG: SCO family protein [Ktedonobacterales bacterium]